MGVDELLDLLAEAADRDRLLAFQLPSDKQARLEALLEKTAALLKSDPSNLETRVQKTIERQKELERELESFCGARPMSLVLPCLYSELAGPALGNIVAELSKVPYLDEIVIGLDRASDVIKLDDVMQGIRREQVKLGKAG